MNEQQIEDERPETIAGPPHRSTIFTTFVFAFAGIIYLLRSQRNARIHFAAAIAVCSLAAWLGLDRYGWAILILTIAMVWILEAINTAIEAAVDLASPQRQPLAKIAKDVSAAAVLIAAITAVVVGSLLFGPLIRHRL